MGGVAGFRSHAMETVTQSHLTQFCPELKLLLDAELRAGNTVVETSTGWPKPQSILVMLAEPFKAPPTLKLPNGIVYNDVNDPHWWKADYFHEASGHALACRMPH
jgi:hypothetical protein